MADWVSFFMLVNKGDFNLDNIATQLFLDVVKFTGCHNIHAMRFTDGFKNFWRAYRLFHSKFIRFMGGYKNRGFLRQSQDKRNTLFPDQSTINFVCPDIKRLRENKAKMEINCSKPGLIVSNIISLVGKRRHTAKRVQNLPWWEKLTIRFGNKLGEVDLYGHETAPTLTEKTRILREEEQMAKNTQELVRSKSWGTIFYRIWMTTKGMGAKKIK